MLTLKIYGYYGKLLTEKSCRVQIFEKKEYPTVNLLCIGDSMTMAETYIAHTVNKLKNINTIGLRNISHNVNHEGRGGWTCSAYFEKYTDDGWGISPFLFPEGFDGKEYYGDKKFYEYMLNSNTDYSHIGTSVTQMQDGMVICDNDKLYRYSKGIYDVVCENPVFKFDFSKYIERYSMPTPDIVSILFGANEFQICSYSEFDNELNKFICNLNNMIEAIHKYNHNIKIVINLPICGGDQYSWGTQLGCKSSAKQYEYCIKMACSAITDLFDRRRNENIFVCPMLAVCDTVNGFQSDYIKSNIYSEHFERHITNWVHPSEIGYKQMGDALAGVIADICDN